MSVIYGDTTFVNDGKLLVLPAKKTSKYIMPFCHQSTFVKTELLKKHHFDTSFKICADNDFFVKIEMEGHRFYKVDEIIAVYDMEGLSSKSPFGMFFENLAIARKYSKFAPLTYAPKFCSLGIKYLLKKALPTLVIAKIKAKLYAKS